jgi:hypothetical protein
MRRLKPRLYVESDEQIALFKHLSGVPYRGLTLRHFVFAVPNAGSRGGRRAMLQAMRRVAEGLTKGVPDICCIVPAGGYHDLWIELKKPQEDGGKPSDLKKEQKEWIARLNELGHKAEVAYGWKHAWQILRDYLSLGETAR